jgi:excisionase family DNA binding protein
MVPHGQAVLLPRGGALWTADGKLPAADARLLRVTGPRFLQLADVAEILNISAAQTYALVRSGELPAIKIGGRGQWRVEREQLETYIQRAYAQTREFVQTHPYGRGDEDEVPAD